MKIKWTSKALSDLVRLYEFLAVKNKLAAAQAVQSLSAYRIYVLRLEWLLQ